MTKARLRGERIRSSVMKIRVNDEERREFRMAARLQQLTIADMIRRAVRSKTDELTGVEA